MIQNNKINHSTEIIPDLWIGDKRSIYDTKFLKDNKFKCIINCTKNIEINDHYKHAEYTHIMIGENSHTDLFKDNLELYKKMDDLIAYIHKFLSQNLSVLIYCKGCIQRAPTIAACYLINHGCMTIDKSIDHIKTKRENVFQPRVSFYLTLEKYHDSILRN